MTSNDKRFRKQLATTVHPDTFNVVMALCNPVRKGHFLDEAIRGYMISSYIFNCSEHGALMLRCPGNFYHFVDYNDEQQSPDFRSMTEALYWIEKTYPGENRINMPEGEEKTLF